MNMYDSFRTGTILSGKHIMLRTFVLMAYFFVASNLTHEQIIHEVGLDVVDDSYKLSTGSKTSSATTVFYHQIFRFNIEVIWM